MDDGYEGAKILERYKNTSMIRLAASGLLIRLPSVNEGGNMMTLHCDHKWNRGYVLESHSIIYQCLKQNSQMLNGLMMMR